MSFLRRIIYIGILKNTTLIKECLQMMMQYLVRS